MIRYLNKSSRKVAFMATALLVSLSMAPRAEATLQHPGILSTKAELDFIKKMVNEGKNPWKQAFDRMKGSATAKVDYKPRAVEVIDVGHYLNPRIGYDAHIADAEAVYLQALMWYITGNDAHAKNVIAILKAWATTLKEFKGNNSQLQRGWTGTMYARGAEIIKYNYPGWDPEVEKQFKAFLDKFYLKELPMGSGNAGNWAISMFESYLALSIYLDDEAMFNDAVPKVMRAVTVYLNGDGSGRETCRDMKHMQFGLGGIINGAEILLSQGIDMYKERDNRIMKSMEFHARIQNNKLTQVQGLSCTIKEAGYYHPSGWEIGYNHYVNRLGFSMPETKKLLEKRRPDGMSRHWGWGSLTHAETGQVPGLKPNLRPTPPTTVHASTEMHELRTLRVLMPGLHGDAPFDGLDANGRRIRGASPSAAPIFLPEAINP